MKVVVSGSNGSGSVGLSTISVCGRGSPQQPIQPSHVGILACRSGVMSNKRERLPHGSPYVFAFEWLVAGTGSLRTGTLGAASPAALELTSSRAASTVFSRCTETMYSSFAWSNSPSTSSDEELFRVGYLPLGAIQLALGERALRPIKQASCSKPDGQVSGYRRQLDQMASEKVIVWV